MRIYIVFEQGPFHDAPTHVIHVYQNEKSAVDRCKELNDNPLRAKHDYFYDEYFIED